MKKSSRKPNRRVATTVPLNEVSGVTTEVLVRTNAHIAINKLEGREMLLKVKEYEPVVIKGYKYAF